MIVDVHTHIFPDELAPKAMYRLQQAAAGVVAYLDGTKADLLRSMESAGIDRSVVCPVTTKPTQDQAANEWVTSLGDERLIPFGTVHAANEDAPGEVRRAVRLGVKGFKLHPEYQDFAPMDPHARPMLEAIAEAGVPVLFHAGVDIEIPTVHGTPHAFAKLNDSLPELDMILAHMGSYRMWDEVSRWLVGRHVHFDTSYVHQDLSSTEFAALARELGAEKVLFGSDSPWGEQDNELASVRAAGLSEGETAAILGGNAARLLGL